MSYNAGYSIGLDMTVRGTEDRSFRKSGDCFAVLGPWLTTADEIADPDDLLLSFSVNGEKRQEASTREMTVGVAELISFAYHAYTLYPGDIIMTGTPDGVGPVAPGDVIDRKRVVWGKMVSERVESGGGRNLKKKKK